MLLKAEDLPGAGWSGRGQRAWLTGLSPDATEAARRARGADSVSAMRFFVQAGPRLLWVEVIPLLSAPDAESLLPTLPAHFVRTKIAVTAEQRLEPHEIPEVAAYPFVYEQSTQGRRGPGVGRYVAGTVGPILFIVAFSAVTTADVPWTDVASVAASQAAKISRTLNASTQPQTG
jgi:hypothetical protein